MLFGLRGDAFIKSVSDYAIWYDVDSMYDIIDFW
jgi:hypothetical protein